MDAHGGLLTQFNIGALLYRQGQPIARLNAEMGLVMQAAQKLIKFVTAERSPCPDDANVSGLADLQSRFQGGFYPDQNQVRIF